MAIDCNSGQRSLIQLVYQNYQLICFNTFQTAVTSTCVRLGPAGTTSRQRACLCGGTRGPQSPSLTGTPGIRTIGRIHQQKQTVWRCSIQASGMINRATLQQVLSVKNSPSISKYYIALLFHVNSIPSLSKRLFVKFELVWQICSDTVKIAKFIH